MRLALAAFVFSGFAFSAHADENISDHYFTGRGFASSSCGAWLEARSLRNAQSTAMKVWILGYVTAYDQYVSKDGDLFRQSDDEALAAWVDSYCRAHPLDRLVRAASFLIKSQTSN
jgi:hypothetical protein